MGEGVIPRRGPRHRALPGSAAMRGEPSGELGPRASAGELGAGVSGRSGSAVKLCRVAETGDTRGCCAEVQESWEGQPGVTRRAPECRSSGSVRYGCPGSSGDLACRCLERAGGALRGAQGSVGWAFGALRSGVWDLPSKEGKICSQQGVLGAPTCALDERNGKATS